MILKYGNQTVNLYNNLKDLLYSSEYKEAIDKVDYDDNFLPKRIVISLSVVTSEQFFT